MTAFFDKNHKKGVLIFVFFIAFLFFPAQFSWIAYPLNYDGARAWWSLDPSWYLTLNYANINNLAWGEDFIFTYGPLGYLSTRFLWGVNKYVVLLFDLFVVINFFLIFYKVIVSSENKLLASAMILVFSIITPLTLGSNLPLFLLLFLLFWINESFFSDKNFHYIFQIICVCLLFFIKVNSGIIALLFYFIAIAYNFYTKKNHWKKTLLLLIIPIISIVLLSKLFNLNILGYVKYSLELIKGYNQIMYLDSAKKSDFIPFSFVLLAFLLFLFFSEIKKHFKSKKLILVIILFFNFGGLWYILYKQAFVRGDLSHISEYFTGSIFLAVLVFHLFYKDYKKHTTVVMVLILAVSFAFRINQQNDLQQTTLAKVKKGNYIASFLNFEETKALNLYPNDNSFPEDILNKIGNSSVDVYPWNSYLLFENRLNFIPRPVFQSYTTYTKKLQEKNFDFYNSEKAPNFVIYDCNSIEGRYGFFDDSMLNLCLVKNYEVVSSFDFKGSKMLLLKKKKGFKPITLTKSKEYAMYTTSPIVPEENIYYEVEVYENFKGKIYSFFSYSPKIDLKIAVKRERPKTYRTSVGLLNAGIFSDTFVSEVDDIIKIQNKEGKKVKYYTIQPQNEKLFYNKIKVTEYVISQ